MKRRTRKLGIGAKIIIPTVIVNIIVCILIGSVITSKAKSGMITVGGQVAKSVAQASTGKFNPNQISVLIGAKSINPDTSAVQDILNTVLENYDVTDVSILGVDGESVFYVVSTKNGGQIAYGTDFEHDYNYLKNVYEAQELKADDFITKTSSGSVITAYAPLVSNGNVICIIAGDYDASGIESEVAVCREMSVVISIICALIASIIVIALVSTVVRNLNKVNSKVYELASNEGDLTQTIDINSGDETELIAKNFNVLLEYIRNIMLSINKNADSLKESSGEIVNNLGVASGNVTDITDIMGKMSNAMTDTTDAIYQVAQQIQSMNEKIENVYGQAKDGSNATEEINKHAEEIRKNAVIAKRDAKVKAEQMAELLNDKIEKSRQVEEIDTLTEQILSITSQTRLLSLNASIEAARAGEAGRGFSVVAEEIGKLANESGQAAGKIQEVSTNVIVAVKELAEEAENMIRFVDDVTMSGFDNLEQTSIAYSKDAQELNDLMEQFASISQALREYSDSIRSAVDTVNNTAEETSREIENVAEMTTQVAGKIGEIERDAQNSEVIAVELNGEVNKFKLNS